MEVGRCLDFELMDFRLYFRVYFEAVVSEVRCFGGRERCVVGGDARGWGRGALESRWGGFVDYLLE